MVDKKISLMSVAGLIIASPVLLIVLIIAGVFSLGKLSMVLMNPMLIGVIILFDVMLYRADKLDIKNAIITGVVFGFLFWLIGLVGFLAGISAICNIPIIGGLICGGISAISLFTDALGFILGGVIISSIFTGLLLLFKR